MVIGEVTNVTHMGGAAGGGGAMKIHVGRATGDSNIVKIRRMPPPLPPSAKISHRYSQRRSSCCHAQPSDCPQTRPMVCRSVETCQLPPPLPPSAKISYRHSQRRSSCCQVQPSDCPQRHRMSSRGISEVLPALSPSGNIADRLSEGSSSAKFTDCSDDTEVFPSLPPSIRTTHGDVESSSCSRFEGGPERARTSSRLERMLSMLQGKAGVRSSACRPSEFAQRHAQMTMWL